MKNNIKITGSVKVNGASFKGAINAGNNIDGCIAERGPAGFSPIANVVTNGDDVTITITDYKGTTTATIPDMSDEVERIEALIPNTASPTNKLVDTATLNSSVQTATSNFRGDWVTYADIPTDVSLYPVDAAGVRTPSTNDYLVVVADEEQNCGTWRYKYVGLWSVDGKNGWQAEYQVNETPFTADQLAAINSGITSDLVEEIGQGGGGGLEIGDIGIAPLGIDETAGKRRILNGQVIIQDQYVEFTNKVKTAVELYPSLACTEAEWQTTVTMSAFGACGKFVIDDNAGTIRLPKITGFIQGLTDLNKLGDLVEAGLPNIEATSKSYMTGVVWDNDDHYSGAFYQIQRRTRNNTGTNSSTYDQIGFDASRSNSTYGNSNTVQPEAIQYPYFIQVATGASTQDNITNTIELNNPFFYGLSQYFESEPNNLSWLKSNGQWNSKAIHTDYYDWLLKIYNGVETVEGISVKLYSETYTDYDFVINTANETFRLPLLNGDETLNSGTLQILTPSNGLEVVAPRNGFYVLLGGGTSNAYVLLREKGSEYGSICYTVNTTNNARATLFVKKGTTVQVYYTTSTAQMQFCPAVGNGDLYYYVGETVQNANLINAGRIEEKLADKTDKVQASLASMPSGRYIELTPGASRTIYQAPANGWFTAVFHWDSYNQANWSGLFTIKDAEVGLTVDNLIMEAVCSQGGADNNFTLPIAKGQYALINYNDTTSPPSEIRVRFHYAQGEI